MTILLHCLQKEFSQEEYSSTLMFLHNCDSHIFLIMEMKGGECGFQTWRAVSIHSKRFLSNKENQFNLTVIEKQKKVFAPLLITRIEPQSWANLSTHPSIQIKSSFLCDMLLFSS